MLAPSSKSTLQLLLFVDDRPGALEVAREVGDFLRQRDECETDLLVIDVTSKPGLAEHYKVVTTPMLLRTFPEPRQSIGGRHLLVQLQHCWEQWQSEAITSATQSSDLSVAVAQSSEIVRLSDEVFRLKQELANYEAQLHFKDRIIGMLAHDLRSPLTTISLALETIETLGMQLPPHRVEEFLRQARAQAKVADTMIVDLLEAARGNRAELKLQLQKIHLDRLCHNVLEDFALRSRLESKQQILLADIPADLPEVCVDEERIRQVLMNLLGNAHKYTPMGGRISVTLLHRTTQKLEVSITDNGPGIPAEMRERIFEDCCRLDRDGQEDGYGIGLAVCRRIIRAHYGQIWVEPVTPQGSCFRFTLPVY